MKLRQELLVKIERLKVLKCDRCPKVFMKFSDLKDHMSNHDKMLLSHIISAYVSVKKLEIYHCNNCAESFTSKREYILHQIEHVRNNVKDKKKQKILDINQDIEKPYKCPDCDLKFVAKTTLQKHSVLHLPFPHVCHCGIGYYKQQDLIIHNKLVHGHNTKEKINPNNSRKKEVISKQNANLNGSRAKANLIKKVKSAWKVHLNNERPKRKLHKWNIPKPDIKIEITPDNRFACPECMKNFANRFQLYVHYRIHSGERPFSCEHCGKRFTQSGALKVHITGQHEHKGERKYVCEVCGKGYLSQEARSRHQKIHKEKTYKCSVCTKAFHDPSAFIRHKRTHTKEMKYPCPYCPKAFTDASGLIVHRRRHEKNKKFVCKICGIGFYTQNCVKLHMRMHDTAESYWCDYCKRHFRSKDSLVRHIKKHLAGNNEFECKLCSKIYFGKDNLRTHVLYKHEKVKSVKKKTVENLVVDSRIVNNIELNGKAQSSEHKEIRFECNDCSEKFSEKRNLIKHIQSIHANRAI